MTKRIFDDDGAAVSCRAEVVSCEALEDGFAVVLNATVFFPEGGGQLSDTGTINGVFVRHVAEKDGVITHFCEKSFAVGQSVECCIDAEMRLDHSQQHTGEHMLSGAFWTLFGAKNIGFHMTEQAVTIDLDTELTAEQCRAAETYANRQIYENKPVNIVLCQESEIDGLHPRKVTEKAHGLLRVVVIENGDVCTCCGTHVAYTGAVGLIRILKAERHRGGMRLEVLCGRKALLDAQMRADAVQELMGELSCGPERLAESVRGIKTELKDCAMRLRAASAKLMDYYAAEALESAREIKGVKCVFVPAEISAQEAKQLLTRLLADGRCIAGVFYPAGERLSYLIGATENVPLSCREAAGIANGLINGKGGGSVTLAQGAGKKTADWRELAAMTGAAVERMI